MTRHPMEATASELQLLAEELQSLTDTPDALDRAEQLLWQTADRLSRDMGPWNDDPTGFVFPGLSPALPLLARILN